MLGRSAPLCRCSVDPGDDGDDWSQVALGARRCGSPARLAPSSTSPGPRRSSPRSVRPVVVRAPPPCCAGAGGVRAVGARGRARRSGDALPRSCPPSSPATTPGLSEDLEEDFRTTGLTHLTAVSGTNLTLVLGVPPRCWPVASGCGREGCSSSACSASSGSSCWPGPSRRCSAPPSWAASRCSGCRPGVAPPAPGRWAPRRPGSWSSTPGWRCPPGFALSVLATGGILLVGAAAARRPGRLDAPGVARRRSPYPWLRSWRAPRWSRGCPGRCRWSRSLANLVVAPVVGPATVLGLLGGLVGLVVPPLGAPGRPARAAGAPGGSSPSREHAAALPTAAVGLAGGRRSGSTLLTVLCLVALGRADRLLRRRGPALTACGAARGRGRRPGVPTSRG